GACWPGRRVAAARGVRALWTGPADDATGAELDPTDPADGGVVTSRGTSGTVSSTSGLANPGAARAWAPAPPMLRIRKLPLLPRFHSMTTEPVTVLASPSDAVCSIGLVSKI